jgi:DNA-binding CsgD family transcriptional regulator
MTTSTLDERNVAELADLLTLVHASEDAEEGAEIPWPFLDRLRELVACDALAFLRQDPRQGRDHFCQGVSEEGHRCHDDSSEESYEGFWHHYWSCASSSYADTASDYTRITKISDFYSSRQWHSTGMYADYAHPHEIEHELTMCLPDGAGRSIRLLCYRAVGSDFGERDRLLLGLLRPHVGEAYHAAVRRRNAPASLTPRQVEILELVREGCTNLQIGHRLHLSEGTVRTHLNTIYARLGVTSRTAAVVRGLES